MTDPTLPCASSAAPRPPPPVLSTLDERVAAYSCNTLPADYSFDPTLSIDDNYMVLTLIYARLSTSKRGNMACIIVDPCSTRAPSAAALHDILITALNDGEPPVKRRRASSPSSSSSASPDPFPNYPGRVLAHSNNTPEPHTVPPSSSDAVGLDGVVKPARTGKKAQQSPFLARASNFPELHAEARSLCLAARAGIPTLGATAYVSFPPCQACLPLLVAAGVTRLVYRQRMAAQGAVELCRREGVECVEVLDKDKDEDIKARVGRWWKERGEGRDETRTRLDRWWKEQERRIMGPPEVVSVDCASGAAAGAGQGSVAPREGAKQEEAVVGTTGPAASAK
ncbi:hypothetical protein JCM3775_006129 [Rhodotorula graminis]|uniref:CMP/dCMP-type deaminase domain-containing protein n=1 Tax=Rhodotorula graminis (strain WP1) TaxID=578459 RepID=A0A194S198_RHOGW|nr:uncharacterized protein RHOBADRAFT_54306 [Rhodotorula graminis WP1]KPV74493.1 hypothetical protein RHOBADRAFT_54306 [Rhodotorula graminis WP1]